MVSKLSLLRVAYLGRSRAPAFCNSSKCSQTAGGGPWLPRRFGFPKSPVGRPRRQHAKRPLPTHCRHSLEQLKPRQLLSFLATKLLVAEDHLFVQLRELS